ncbi:MAG: hypothetical protein ACO3E1_10335 [Flavobacteriales bacterium]
MRIRYVLSLISALCLNLAIAQDSIKYNIFRIGFGNGAFNYVGDIGTFKQLGAVDDLRVGHTFTLNQRFLTMFSADILGFYGKVASNERSGARNLNFESSVMGGQFTLGFHFDNKYMMKSGKLGPFIFGGAGYFLFDPKGDLKDANGETYFYWSDGSIRNMIESSANIPLAKKLERDFTYESELKDPNNNYAKSSLMFPVGFGLKARLGRNADFILQGTYYFAQTDYLENFKAGTRNDGFWSATLGFQFNFQKKPASATYTGPDVNALVVNADSDGDGIKDPADKCPFTPSGTKVDDKGCPLDSDGDGVDDLRDAEPKTQKNAFVSDSGVTITDSMFQKMYNDSLSMDHDLICKVYPSLCKEGASDEVSNDGTKLGQPYSIADSDNDGKITIQEIYTVIDKFFDKKAPIKMQDIHKIIDYFFDQQ